ncbi:MAG TPA: META domain-containing protein [Chloroflexia bacterium]|jgi:heat shock protein HslJ
MIKRLAMAAALIMLVAGMPLSAGATAAEGLANTNWVLAEYVAQGSAAVTALGEPPPTLLFGDNGTVRGYTICNSYSGPYSEAGDKVTFGPLASTRRACTNPEFIAQERLMMQVLDGTTTVMRSGDRLVITAPAGSLTFIASDGSDLADPPEIPPTPGMPTTGQPGPDWSLLALLALAPGIILFGVYLRRAEQAR